MLFYHVGVHVTDFEKSLKLYDALLGILEVDGYDLPSHVAKAWGTKTCSFRIVQPPSDDIRASSSHICLTAPSKKTVEEFYRAGTELGAEGVFLQVSMSTGGFVT